jgi:hypothetical protein
VSEQAKGALTDAVGQLRPLLMRLDTALEAERVPTSLWRNISLLYGDVIPKITRDRDVFVRSRWLGGQVRWRFWRKSSEKEERLDRLQRDDPELFETVSRSKEVFKLLDDRIQKDIQMLGLKPSYRPVRGVVVNVGEDPETGEVFAFTNEGEMMPLAEFKRRRKKQLRAEKAQRRVFPRHLNRMREVSDEELEEATGSIQYVSLTDDKVKARQVTRIYPVRKLNGRDVVVDGRFKGFYLDDLVNAAGRLIEGTAYNYDPSTKRAVPLETRNPDGSPNVTVTREPYVTVLPDGNLFLSIPRTRASEKRGDAGYTAQRNAVADLAPLIPTLNQIGKGKHQFTFSPADFDAVREALGGAMALSGAAMKTLREHFETLAKHEMALEETNLRNYETGRIGGFKRDKKLYNKQRKAMAWLESRDISGVCALDTGVGKTALTVAMMQKMKRDGLLDDGGEVLYVCPKKLKGNLPKEVRAFLSRDAAKNLRPHLVIKTFGQLDYQLRQNPRWADNFVAVFIDEAHELKNLGKQARRIAGIRNQRKVLLTASPMNRSPMELFNLAAIANNRQLETKEERRAFNAERRAFQARFAEEVGGKIVGIKADPVTAKDFRTWVKQNLYFADKKDVEEVVLPDLLPETVTLTMDPDVEQTYRDLASEVEGTLRDLVRLYRDQDPSVRRKGLGAARLSFKKLFSRLYILANMPDDVFPGAPNPKIDQATAILDERLGTTSRSILWADNAAMATKTARELSNRFGGKRHVLGLTDSIQIWQDGQIVEEFKEGRYPDADGTLRARGDWQVVIFETKVKPDEDILTCTLTGTYAVGQNLQVFDTVIHLDRDAWNNETMKQRTARAWRNGQPDSVEEYTLDMVYDNPVDDRDATLDEIAGHLQVLEGQMFEEMIRESQNEALGKEWFSMKQLSSSFLNVNRKMMELALSPYLSRLGEEEGEVSPSDALRSRGGR